MDAAAAACTGQQQRAVVVAHDGAGDPLTWVGTCGSGLGTCGRRLEWGRGLSRVAVKGGGGGGGGGMYRAAATHHCGWDMGVGAGAGDTWVAEEKAWVCPGSVDWGQGMCPRHRASLSWWVMSHVPCDACVTCHWLHCW